MAQALPAGSSRPGVLCPRRLPSTGDIAAIPFFVAARHFWLLGLRTGNWENWGQGEVDDRAIDEWLAFLPAWEARGYLRGGSSHGS